MPDVSAQEKSTNPTRDMSDEKSSNPNFESAKAHAKEAAQAAKSHLKDAVDSSKEHLKHAADDLRAAAEAKARELRDAAESKTREFRETAESKAREFRSQAEQTYGDTAARVRTFQEDSETYIRQNPLKAVATAAAAGFVLGMLFRR